MNNWMIVFLFCVVGVIGFFVGQFIEKQQNVRQMQKLSLMLDTIMRGNYKPDLSSFKEGEISLLTNQLELVVKRTEYMVTQLNREKYAIRDSIADISHQLKTPLTGLLTYLDLMEGSETDAAKKAQFVKCIYLTERMNDLIRTLLELAKLDSDSVVLNIENHPCNELIASAIQTAQNARLHIKVNFGVEVDDELLIRCDQKWFHQALVNILVNSIDYSCENTPIHISAKQGDGVTIIKVTDHGGSMDEADLQNIFKRFYRAKNSKKDGFGIGLSMTESIIKLHKGNIRAINEGDGLSMILSLPVLNCAESC